MLKSFFQQNAFKSFHSHLFTTLSASAAVSDVILVNHNGSEVYHRKSYSVQSPEGDVVVGGGSGNRTLTFVETVPGVLRCVAFGGYPPPDVQILLDGRDISGQFGVTHVARLSGTRGLRVMHHAAERWTHRFMVGADDDGRRLSCVVSVTGLAPTVRSARLSVYRMSINSSSLPLN